VQYIEQFINNFILLLRCFNFEKVVNLFMNLKLKSENLFKWYFTNLQKRYPYKNAENRKVKKKTAIPLKK